MSVVKGKLQSDFQAPGVSGVIQYLTGRGNLHIQLFDNEGEPTSHCGACPAGGICTEERPCGKVRRQLVARMFDTNVPTSTACGRVKLSVHPIMHSSALFGCMLVCEPMHNLPTTGITQTEALGGGLSMTTAGGQSPDTQTTADLLVDSLAALVARDSFHELEVESLSNDLALRYEELALLYDIGEQIPIRAQTSTVIGYVVNGLQDVIHCTAYCWVPENGEIRTFGGAEGEQPAHPDDMMRRIGVEINQRIRGKTSPITVNDVSADSSFRAYASEISAICGFPVCTEDEHYGTLVLFKAGGKEFKSGEAMLVSAVIRRTGTVLRNTRLYQELNDLFLNTIKTLVRIIEGKDAYTRGHSERVSTFSTLLGDFLQLPLEEKEALSWSSLLHDIGKIRVPEEILKKPGSLTDDEFAVIQLHPGYGADMLFPISQLSHCLPDIRHHHERIDGRGYPDKLRDEEIPPRAKIIAVADTFDALTSDRCYRPRFGLDKAVNIIEEVAGSQLSARAAEALVKNQDAFIEHLQCAKKK